MSVRCAAALAATWQCGSETAEWIGHPDLSQCVSERVSNLALAYQRLFDNVLFTVVYIIRRLGFTNTCQCFDTVGYIAIGKASDM